MKLAKPEGWIFKGRDYFPGLGKDQNMGINITNSNGFNATFEQHASVPGLEAAGLALLEYSSVNVAQKLTLGLSGNNLSVSAATDVFPSATLSVNGNQLFKYYQPSFKGTHGNDLINFGTRTSAPGIIGRPAPNFIIDVKKIKNDSFFKICRIYLIEMDFILYLSIYRG